MSIVIEMSNSLTYPFLQLTRTIFNIPNVIRMLKFKAKPIYSILVKYNRFDSVASSV